PGAANTGGWVSGCVRGEPLTARAFVATLDASDDLPRPGAGGQQQRRRGGRCRAVGLRARLLVVTRSMALCCSWPRSVVTEERRAGRRAGPTAGGGGRGIRPPYLRTMWACSDRANT